MAQLPSRGAENLAAIEPQTLRSYLEAMGWSATAEVVIQSGEVVAVRYARDTPETGLLEVAVPVKRPADYARRVYDVIAAIAERHLKNYAHERTPRQREPSAEPSQATDRVAFI